MTSSNTLPTDPHALADWLEQQLVGLELANWVARLEALRREITDNEQADAVTLSSLFSATELSRVLEEGLSATQEVVPRLFAHPSILFELQEKIFVEGGAYWDRVDRSEEHRQLMRESVERRHLAIKSQQNSPSAPVTPAREPTSSSESKKRPWVPAWVIAVAASIFVAGIAWRLLSSANSGGSEFVLAIEDNSLSKPDLQDKDFVDALNTALPPHWNQINDPKEFESLLFRYKRACLAIAKVVADPMATYLTDPKDARRVSMLLQTCATGIAQLQARLQAGEPLDELKIAANKTIDDAQIELTNLAATIAARGDSNL